MVEVEERMEEVEGRMRRKDEEVEEQKKRIGEMDASLKQLESERTSGSERALRLKEEGVRMQRELGKLEGKQHEAEARTVGVTREIATTVRKVVKECERVKEMLAEAEIHARVQGEVQTEERREVRERMKEVVRQSEDLQEVMRETLEDADERERALGCEKQELEEKMIAMSKMLEERQARTEECVSLQDAMQHSLEEERRESNARRKRESAQRAEELASERQKRAEVIALLEEALGPMVSECAGLRRCVQDISSEVGSAGRETEHEHETLREVMASVLAECGEMTKGLGAVSKHVSHDGQCTTAVMAQVGKGVIDLYSESERIRMALLDAEASLKGLVGECSAMEVDLHDMKEEVEDQARAREEERMVVGLELRAVIGEFERVKESIAEAEKHARRDAERMAAKEGRIEQLEAETLKGSESTQRLRQEMAMTRQLSREAEEKQAQQDAGAEEARREVAKTMREVVGACTWLQSELREVMEEGERERTARQEEVGRVREALRKAEEEGEELQAAMRVIVDEGRREREERAKEGEERAAEAVELEAEVRGALAALRDIEEERREMAVGVRAVGNECQSLRESLAEAERQMWTE
eukprot:3326580-Rhodomonas_salina.1